MVKDKLTEYSSLSVVLKFISKIFGAQEKQYDE